MLMRILHTSDWHLGMPLKLGTMIEDQQYFLDQMYSIMLLKLRSGLKCMRR